MKLSCWIVLLAMVICTRINGQSIVQDSTKNNKIGYFFSIQSGALIGDQVTFSASTIQGVKMGRKLRLGGGIGFDSFMDSQTTPVFGIVSWDLFGKKNVVFVQGNYGWAPYAWSPLQKDEFGFKKIEGKEHISAMVGYRIKSGDISVSILAGLKHQQIEKRYEYPV